jgi:hypothetical protein
MVSLVATRPARERSLTMMTLMETMVVMMKKAEIRRMTVIARMNA